MNSSFLWVGKTINEQALYEYLAFILKLYGAQPVAGLAHLHGKKGKAVVHMGAVDAPLTIDEINAAIGEYLQIKQNEFPILAPGERIKLDPFRRNYTIER